EYRLNAFCRPRLPCIRLPSSPESARTMVSSSSGNLVHALPLSADDRTGLRSRALVLAARLERIRSDSDLRSLVHDAARETGSLAERAVATGNTRDDLLTGLKRLGAGTEEQGPGINVVTGRMNAAV